MQRFLATVSVAVILSFGVQAQEVQKSNSAISNATTDPLKAAAEKLRGVLGGSINVEDLACTFRPAVWVGLPVTIRVSSTETRDGQPYIFVMKKGGLLSQKKDPNPLPSGITGRYYFLYGFVENQPARLSDTEIELRDILEIVMGH